jgi:hypothetical protein
MRAIARSPRPPHVAAARRPRCRQRTLEIEFLMVSCFVFMMLLTRGASPEPVEGGVAEAVGTMNAAARVPTAMHFRARLVWVGDGFMIAPLIVSR